MYSPAPPDTVISTDPEPPLHKAFVADADPSTTTDPLNSDSDEAGESDGQEDANQNGRVDEDEKDPNDPSDDLFFDEDEDGLNVAASFEVTDGPNDDGEMFQRPAKLSDKFIMPYGNVKEAQAANGGAYPPDMSVLAKARSGGVDYIYSVLLGYEDPPNGVTLDDGVYYNKYMYGNKIKMSQPLYDGSVEYSDGTEATEEQMAKDVVTFLMWSAEPHLEARHKMGFKAILYLIVLTILVYFSMKKIWSRIESKV